MGCSVSHSGRKEKGRAYLTWWMLVAGKGLNEDVTNGAAARPVGAARELKREERVARPLFLVRAAAGGSVAEDLPAILSVHSAH